MDTVTIIMGFQRVPVPAGWILEYGNIVNASSRAKCALQSCSQVPLHLTLFNHQDINHAIHFQRKKRTYCNYKDYFRGTAYDQ